MLSQFRMSYHGFECLFNSEIMSKKVKFCFVENIAGGGSGSPKRKSREEKAVSDLLLQLQEERSKVTEMMSKNKVQAAEVRAKSLVLGLN